MTYADDPDFWDRQERLGRVAEAIETISDADRDFGSVAIDGRRNLIRVFRRIRDVDRNVAESVYREVVPADVGLEFPASLLTADEQQAIMHGFVGFTGRRASRGFRLETIGCRETGGPVVVSYLQAREPLNFELLVALGVSATWPADAVERGAARRGAVRLHMLEEATIRQRHRPVRDARG